jgi:hypothetical protein
MFQFQQAMRRWLPWIQRTAYCSKVSIDPTKNGEFYLKAVWPATKGGPAGEYRVHFTRSRVLGTTSMKGRLCQRTTKKVCRFRDDIVRAILAKRGVTK